MAIPVATLHDDVGQFQRRFSITDKGLEATTYYRINTRDMGTAPTAVGLPAVGSVYNATYADLTVIRVNIQPLIGFDTGATGNDGYCIAEVEYATPSIEVLPFKLGRLFTVIDSDDEVKTETRARFVTVGGVETQTPLTVPGGFARVYGFVRATVVKHVAHSFPIDDIRLIQLTSAKSVNDAQITLPPRINSLTPLLIAKGQARYESYRVTSYGEGVVLEHNLSLRPNFHGEYYTTDETEEPTSDKIEYWIYEPASFAGLW